MNGFITGLSTDTNTQNVNKIHATNCHTTYKTNRVGRRSQNHKIATERVVDRRTQVSELITVTGFSSQ